jgi:hypothetical protein
MTQTSNPDAHIELLRMLAKRLERLSVDSIWARRANGLRGSIVKALTDADAGTPPGIAQLDLLIEHSFQILSKAAREIPDREEMLADLIAIRDKLAEEND